MAPGCGEAAGRARSCGLRRVFGGAIHIDHDGAGRPRVALALDEQP
jgi:hypothetical protein